MKKRKSFLLHIDSLDILDDLEDQQVANLFRAIKAHQKGEDMELDALTKIAFIPFKNQFERDQEKYEETCKRRAEAGSKGGKAKVANASKSKQKVANLADNDNKNKSKNKNKSDNDNDSNNIKTPVSHSLNYSSWPSLPSDQVLKDWLAMRKRLKANVTQTVINRLTSQLKIASSNGFTVDDCLSECILRNWRGFQFEWMKSKTSNIQQDFSSNNYQSGDL